MYRTECKDNESVNPVSTALLALAEWRSCKSDVLTSNLKRVKAPNVEAFKCAMF